jgi:hypothetical protein
MPSKLLSAGAALIACAAASMSAVSASAANLQPAAARRQPTARPQRPAPQPALAWPDAPLSPGRWVYRPAATGRSVASFGSGEGEFRVECIGRGVIAVGRGGSGTSMTIRTTALERTLTGRSEGGRLVVQLPAGDPVLDAMAFSRGRFGVQSPGRAQLVVPAWPELARVVEDCRRLG